MADNYTVSVTLKGANQLSQPVNQATQSLRGLTQEASRTNQAMSQLKTIGMGLFAGVSLAGVARMAEDLYQTGMEAQRAGNLFRSFGAQVGDTDVLLNRLRQTTRGVVTDTELMNAANSMLSMGLAKNATDVERLTNIGVTFAQAMGQDVGASLENLNMILANQSYLRLDSLGISSSQVRALAETYRAAGMDSADAFNAAFLDVAEQKLPQMSAVADATVTQLQQLQTSVDNWWTDFGNRFATGVNGMIGLAGLLGDALARVWQQGSGNGATIIGGGTMTDPITGASIVIPQMNVSGDMIIASGGYSAAEAATNAAMQAQIAAYRNGGATSAALGLYRAGERGDYRPVPDPREPYRLTIGANAGHLLEMSRRESGLFTPEDVRLAQDYLYVMEQARDTLANMGADDTVLNQMDLMLESARGWAGAIDDGATRLESMNLAQIMGQSGGGRLGELTDIATAALEGAGIADGITAGFENQLNLASGRETVLSMWVDKNFGPMVVDVVEQYGTEAGAAFVQSMNEALDYTSITGATFDPATMLPYMYQPGTGSGEGSYTIQPGDTLSAIAAQRGMTVEELARMNGISNPGMIFAGQTLNFGSGGSLVPNKGYMEYEAPNPLNEAVTSAEYITDEMTKASETLATGIEAVFAKKYQLPIELVITALSKDALSQAIATVVQGAGGTTPGSSTFTGKSGTGASGSRGTVGGKAR